tara:strand:+ start:10494 stop:11072 length:579 start_codon:yes stop_codon:yes gene_type:complete
MGERWAKRLKTYTSADDLRALETAKPFIDDEVAQVLMEHRICTLQNELQQHPVAQPSQPASDHENCRDGEAEGEDQEGEEWRDVPDHLGLTVSNLGRIMKHGVIQDEKPLSDTGYHRVSYQGNYKKIARLVCMAFHGKPPADRPICDHINRKRWDDRASNLRWVNRSESGLNNIKRCEFGLKKKKGARMERS